MCSKDDKKAEKWIREGGRTSGQKIGNVMITEELAEHGTKLGFLFKSNW